MLQELKQTDAVTQCKIKIRKNLQSCSVKFEIIYFGPYKIHSVSKHK